MRAQDTSYLFRNFTYSKSSTEIVDKMKAKRSALQAKIVEREGRVMKIRAEYKITDAVLIDLLQQARAASKRGADVGNRMSYSSKGGGGGDDDSDDEREVTVGAGVVNLLLTENDFIESETAQVTRLELLIRNLKDEERDWSEGRKIGWNLSEDELRYLEF